jgi:hypothetical protein
VDFARFGGKEIVRLACDSGGSGRRARASDEILTSDPGDLAALAFAAGNSRRLAGC